MSAYGAAVTVTLAVAVRVFVVYPAPRPVASTVIVAVPGAMPVTTPEAGVTLATLVALLAYVYVTLTALLPKDACGVNPSVCPTTTVPLLGDTLMLASAGGSAETHAISHRWSPPPPPPQAESRTISAPSAARPRVHRTTAFSINRFVIFTSTRGVGGGNGWYDHAN